MPLVRRSSKTARLLEILTLIWGGVFFVLPTVWYFQSQMAQVELALHLEAQAASKDISALIANAPEFWKYEQYRIPATLETHYITDHPVYSEGGRYYQIVDSSGTVISDAGDSLDGMWKATSIVPLFDFGTEVGQLSISAGLQPLLVRVLEVALLSLIVAMAVFIPIRIYPIRQLRRNEEELEHAYKHALDLNEELEKANTLAYESNRMKSRFLANMSHEIRTPMSAIIGMSDLALQTELDSKQRHYIDRVSIAARGLLGIINDILDLSKLEAGKVTLENRSLYVSDVTEQVRALTDMEAEKKGIHFRVNVAPDVPRLVGGDQLRLMQVLTNLCANAIKFTAPGGEVSLGVTASSHDEKAADLHFEIRDNGVGMSEAQLQTVFESFTQGDLSTTRQYGGTGLGLTIANQLIHLMGGVLEVQSEVGKGSIFHFTLSMEEADAEWSGSSPELSDDAAVSRIKLAGARVLLVEDSLDSQELVSEFLAMAGMVVTVANHGEEALQILSNKEKAFDGILMDCSMPVMDGYTASRKIREQPQWKEIPILAFTARVFDEDRQRATDAGMNDLIEKPLDTDKLFTTMARWITPVQPLTGEDRELQQTEQPLDNMDYKSLLPLLNRLERELKEQGFDSIKLLEQLTPHLINSSHQEQFQVLSTSIHEFAFKHALDQLYRLKRELEERQ